MPAVGSHVPQARSGGTWKNWSRFFARHSNTWKRPVSVHVRSGGSWVKVYDERPVITNVSTFYVDNGQGGVQACKEADISANGFTTSVSTNIGGVDISTVNVDQTVRVFAFVLYPVGVFGAFPTIIATNSSDTATA